MIKLLPLLYFAFAFLGKQGMGQNTFVNEKITINNAYSIKKHENTLVIRDEIFDSEVSIEKLRDKAPSLLPIAITFWDGGFSFYTGARISRGEDNVISIGYYSYRSFKDNSRVFVSSYLPQFPMVHENSSIEDVVIIHEDLSVNTAMNDATYEFKASEINEVKIYTSNHYKTHTKEMIQEAKKELIAERKEQAEMARRLQEIRKGARKKS